ncbi:hypothetical protein ACMFMG_010302 [Clarireedia jacksonii]
MESTSSNTSEKSNCEDLKKDFSPAMATLVEHSNDSVFKRHFADIPEFKEHLCDSRSKEDRGAKLYMVSSLGAGIEYLQHFAAHARVEAEVIESHFLRRRCRSSTVRRAIGTLGDGRESRVFALDYPDVVVRDGGDRDGKIHGDESETGRFSLRIDNHRVVVFCRVTLWASDDGSLLLLSDELLDGRRRHVENKSLSRHEAHILRSFRIASDPTTCLREQVLDAATTCKELNFNTLRDILSEFCMEHWTDFLDDYPDPSTTFWTSDEILKMKDMLRANHRTEKFCFISQCQTHATHLPLTYQVRLEDWSYLLETFNQRLPNTTPLSSAAALTAETDIRTQRCINRITYLGAILLPFSIVAAILTLEGEFAPGKSMFWVYWAVGVPISGLVVLIIYADGIRRLTFGEWEEEKAMAEKEREADEFVLDYEKLRRLRKERLVWMNEGAGHMHREIGWAKAFASISGVDAAKRRMAKRQLDDRKGSWTDV